MKTLHRRRIPGIPALAVALAIPILLMGCGSTGLGDILGGGGAEEEITAIRGTVERVDTRDRVIVVDDAETSYRTGLRNEGERLELYYDDRTVVEHEGRTYRPADLEVGDRIDADVDRSGNRLVAHRIDVLYDVTGGTGDRRYEDDRYEDDRYEDRRYDDRSESDLRGEVRLVDTRQRIVEIERTTYHRGFTTGDRSTDVVRLHYDADTIVEFEGRRYEPENLERGDVVDVEVRDLGDRLLAEEIVVVADVRDRVGRDDR